ncbi:hypothetical protein EDD96_4542 [Streptomyces sp. Ag109_G2-6]|nr:MULTISPECIES: hypothetical protein [Streptomyces]RPF40765.1 hypothetical protein EDD96_4542 [Streptomyces sp. Ag109_G2-6]
MSPHQQTALKVVGLAFAVIIAGQLLQHFIGYLIVAAFAGLVLSRFFGRR